ncbi:rRNA maturation RNase YbeY [Peptoniphilus catoniae]|uniref:rRNA maturation RNase YbeY n=1 Tax=Peptoniphilus catoniae TaxID=1660341 RepID=UPI0010FDA2D1|nr:rRNA maturation RNase YbeY [Peptoniphilus catoniae]
MEIFFDNRQDEIYIDDSLTDLIKKSIKAVLDEENLSDRIMVSVSFVNSSEIQSLNRDFRNVDRVTDVLSFPIDDEFRIENRILGDIVINTARVISQAKEYGHSEEREFSYLTVHSTLHLLGYDHEDEEDKNIMRAKEKIIMESLNINR